jgi:hypothetical protein
VRDCGRAIALVQTTPGLHHDIYDVGSGRLTSTPRSSPHSLSAVRRRSSVDEWRAVKDRFTGSVLRKWASYAPNMTADTVSPCGQ